MSARMRFWENVDKTATCWLWIGRKDRHGYGVVHAQGEWLAHRLSWRLHRGPIPDGLTIDHLCRVRACVNPDHMEPVAKGVNTLRGLGPTADHARQTHCVHGHAFDIWNTRLDVSRRGTARVCRACVRDIQRRRRARKRVAA